MSTENFISNNQDFDPAKTFAGLHGYNFSELADVVAESFTEQSKQRDIRSEYGNRITLHDIIERCEDLSPVFSQKGMNKCPQKDKAMTIARAIIKAADGNILCENYNSKDKTRQPVYVYDGKHWSPVKVQRYVSFCKAATARCNVEESLRMDPDFMKLVFDQFAFIISDELPPIIHTNEEWINFQNGTLVIDREGYATLRDHCREDYFFHVLPYCYDPAAECPRFQSFLDQMVPERESQMMLSEFIAQCFIKGRANIHKMLILYGDGSNGKSVLLDVIKALMGGENVSEVPLAELTKDDKKRVLIEHKLLNISHESATGIDHSVFKNLVSGDALDGYINYQGPVTIKDYGKLIASFNELPRAEQTYGFFRRCIILPMTVTITEEERDVNLAKNIIAEELPGILNWVLEGMKRFIASGYQLTKSPICEAALEEYKTQTNSVISFFDDCCTLCDNYRQKGKDVYKAYIKYCEEEGYQHPLGPKKFYKQFGKLGTKPHLYQGTQMFMVKYKERA